MRLTLRYMILHFWSAGRMAVFSLNSWPLGFSCVSRSWLVTWWLFLVGQGSLKGVLTPVIDLAYPPTLFKATSPPPSSAALSSVTFLKVTPWPPPSSSLKLQKAGIPASPSETSMRQKWDRKGRGERGGERGGRGRRNVWMDLLCSTAVVYISVSDTIKPTDSFAHVCFRSLWNFSPCVGCRDLK